MYQYATVLEAYCFGLIGSELRKREASDRAAAEIAEQKAVAERAQKYAALCKRQETVVPSGYMALIRDFEALGNYRDCIRRKNDVHNRLEAHYHKLCVKQMEAYKPGMYAALVKQFEELGNYRDCSERAHSCKRYVEKTHVPSSASYDDETGCCCLAGVLGLIGVMILIMMW